MRGSRRIHHRPYIPYNRMADAARPYVCRLAPGADFVTLEWIAKEDGVRLTVRAAFNGAENFHNANYSLYYYLSDVEIMAAF